MHAGFLAICVALTLRTREMSLAHVYTRQKYFLLKDLDGKLHPMLPQSLRILAAPRCFIYISGEHQKWLQIWWLSAASVTARIGSSLPQKGSGNRYRAEL
jgi:hypothetical protein